MRVKYRIALFGTLLAAACVAPSPTSVGSRRDFCGDDGNPHPPISILGPASVAIGRGTITLTACFPGDREDLAAVAAVQWTSLTPERATVSPPTGRQTEVRGVSFGIARIRAVIKGAPVETEIRVCTNEGTCP